MSSCGPQNPRRLQELPYLEFRQLCLERGPQRPFELVVRMLDGMLFGSARTPGIIRADTERNKKKFILAGREDSSQTLRQRVTGQKHARKLYTARGEEDLYT